LLECLQLERKPSSTSPTPDKPATATEVADEARKTSGETFRESCPQSCVAAPRPSLMWRTGPHAKQVLHFWKAEAEKPTPLVFFIHGGGWQNGNRTSGLAPLLEPLLKAGISVVSIEYRFIAEATADGVVPPVKGPLHDAARALQFVRSKADEWNLDKARIAACGSSAGRVRVCGSHFIRILRTRRVRIPLRGNRLGSFVRR
jgi:acetyl esterase/lipase